MPHFRVRLELTVETAIYYLDAEDEDDAVDLAYSRALDAINSGSLYVDVDDCDVEMTEEDEDEG